ncbi:MAG: T9SS type A sorting domain-containing protein [Salinibacter sp.]|uniref:T9SS type A sorting domain-containing protein n=1 Tax=Salinibacter sp. TaxID=2065818 RepID=UPI0035D517B3
MFERNPSPSSFRQLFANLPAVHTEERWFPKTTGFLVVSLLALVALGLLGVQNAQAQIPQKVITEGIAFDVRDVVSADVDGDGDADVLSASRGIPDIAWYENQIGNSGTDSDGFGDQQVITTKARTAHSVYAADLDGDGDPDALSASGGNEKFAWYENQVGESGADSDGFGPQQVIDTEANPMSIFAADVDGDGDKDVLTAVSSFEESKVAWYESQVGESGADDDGFGNQQVITTDAQAPQSVYAADVNGDGDADVLSASNDDNKVAWYENKVGESGADSNGFGAQQVITTDAKEAFSVHGADVDGDGDPDALSASIGDGQVSWYENQIGEGGTDADGFGARQVITTNMDEATSVHGADVDGDGDADVLSASPRGSDTDPKIAWYESQVGESGANSDDFGAQQVITTSAEGAESVFAADLDGDGDNDALSASREKLAWYENQVGESGADTDGFGPQQIIVPTVATPESVFTADVDGDGDPDALSASSRDNKIAWYENQVGESGADTDGFGDQRVITTGAEAAHSVHAADVDGDGDPDALSASSRDNKIAWYENQVGESGADTDGFGPQQVITTSADFVQSVHAADLDGDGDADALSASEGDDKIAWYKSQVGESGADSDGFGAQQVIDFDDRPGSVHAADIDGDGDPDPLSANAGDGQVSWYENQLGEEGAVQDFGSQRVITFYDNASAVFAADLDGDGDADVLSASSVLDGKIAWNENQVGESGADDDGFGTQQVITPDNGASSVFAADVDGDGDADALSAPDDKIAWYESLVGEGEADSDGFGNRQVVTTEVASATSVFAVDIDGGGDPDVFSTSNQDDKIAWYENTKGVLPVEMASFEARVEDDKVRLTWQTASETGNAGFAVQRRVADAPAPGTQKGDAWQKVGFVESKASGGTTTEAQTYRFTDTGLPYAADRLEYRLRQVDTDGTTHLSKTVTVERGVTEVQLLGTYPNPARSRATVRYALPEKQEVTLRLYDVLGRQVRTVVQAEKAGRHERTLDTSGLSSGLYFLRLQAGGQTRTQKLTVVR